ncbi:AAA family ATPase [Candidatus Dojkabacteria bacterium]|nr:AAA family ATPase [Candidatus Dojkabacteria bacterium]
MDDNSDQQNQIVVFESIEAQNLYRRLTERNFPIPMDLLSKITLMLRRVDGLIRSGNYKEFEPIENYINWVLRIPFGVYAGSEIDIERAKSTLNVNHYGLEDVKDKIIEYLSVIKLNMQNQVALAPEQKKLNAPILLFLGIQGIGKTTMAKSIADSLNRQFVRISLGGMASVNEMRGVSRGFTNSEPGQIIKALINTKCMDPVILLDELDKISESGGIKLDIMAALLEVLDLEQNSTFVDRYLDNPIDISKCLFISTANNIGGISTALLDRMEIVRFSSYSDEDKKQIAIHYLLPKIRKNSGLGESQLSFNEDVWDMIIRPLGFDAGIRELDRTLTNISRKVARKIVENQGTSFEINKDNFREYIPDDFGVYA